MGIKVELAQIKSKLGSVEDNLEKHLEILTTSSADCVIFPELSLTGYVLRDLAFEVFRESEKAIQKIADVTKCAIFGTVKEVRNGILRNSTVVTIGGHIDYVYKFYLPTYGLFEERRYFQAGNPLTDLKVFTLNGMKFGIIICEDAWHPEPAEALVMLGADAIFIPAASPLRRLDKKLLIHDNWESLIKAHSIMYGIWTVFVNSVGSQEEEYFWGGSMVSSPKGEIVARAKLFEEDRISYYLSEEDIRVARFFSSFRDHNNDFHKILSNI